MAKVLLKHVGNRSKKNYQNDIAKISKIAISARAQKTSKMEIYSSRELGIKSGERFAK